MLAWCASGAALDRDLLKSHSIRAELKVGGPPEPECRRHASFLKHLKLTHLTTNDGLSQGYGTAILQDRQPFMWFAARGGLNRYEGNSFVLYKSNPENPASLSSNFLQDLMEDKEGHLWIATKSAVGRIRSCHRKVHPLLSCCCFERCINGDCGN